MCLNDDYTIGLKNVKTNSETIETEPVPNDNVFAIPGLIIQLLEKIKMVQSTQIFPWHLYSALLSSTVLVSTNYPLSKANSSSNDLAMKESTNSDECFENFADPSSPTNLLKTPTPPEVTTIPEDMHQILSIYNSSLVPLVAVRAVPPSKVFLPRQGGQKVRDASNKEN
ncbi:hypothetical protein Celaphus_00001121, partial [Cervus elaphus hippelaphus]